jgi:SAM-dependent methyltransferase
MATAKIADIVPPRAASRNNASPHRDAPNFDPLARVYRWMEYLTFGPMLERCRFHFLPECSGARRALVLGDGDGRFTARLLAANHKVQIDAVDSSAAMLAELHRRAQYVTVNAETRVQTFHADLRDFTLGSGKYDLVASHFFLDCQTDDETAGLVERIVPHLSPDATWLISEFAIPEKSWRRPIARLLIRFLYFAFDKMTHLHVQRIPDYARVLASSGFQRRQQVQMLGGLLVTEVWLRRNLSL